MKVCTSEWHIKLTHYINVWNAGGNGSYTYLFHQVNEGT